MQRLEPGPSGHLGHREGKELGPALACGRALVAGPLSLSHGSVLSASLGPLLHPPLPRLLPLLLCLGLKQPACLPLWGALAEANEVGRLVQFLAEAEAEAGVLAPGMERVGELAVLGFGLW